jgi:CubicO group peptidase (beta-lactamase class C family)
MLTRVKPEEVGFSSARLSAVNKLIHGYIRAGLIPGAIAVIARQGKLVHFNTYGEMDLEQHKPMREETIFRIHSMTKPLTAIALLILYEQGHFQLSDPVSKYIPIFKDLKVLEGSHLVAPKRPMTIHDLLTHRAGFSHVLHDSSLGELYRSASILKTRGGENLERFIQKLTQFPLAFHPGAHWHYSLSYNILAYLVELFSHMPFDEWMAKKVTAPLSMLDTSFYVPKHKISRLAVLYTHDHPENQGQSGEVSPLTLQRMPETEEILLPPTLLAGGGGLVSTANDYLRFCQMLLNQGELEGNRIVSRKSIELMTSQNLPGDLAHIGLNGQRQYGMGLSGVGYGLGVGIMLNPAQAQILGTKGDYFWYGIANTSFFIDPQEKIIGIFLTQVKSSTRDYSFQRDFRVAVYQALTS